jgi:ribosomal protein L18
LRTAGAGADWLYLRLSCFFFDKTPKYRLVVRVTNRDIITQYGNQRNLHRNESRSCVSVKLTRYACLFFCHSKGSLPPI